MIEIEKYFDLKILNLNKVLKFKKKYLVDEYYLTNIIIKSRKPISFKTWDSKLFLVVSEGKWKKLLFQIMLFLISRETFFSTLTIPK